MFSSEDSSGRGIRHLVIIDEYCPKLLAHPPTGLAGEHVRQLHRAPPAVRLTRIALFGQGVGPAARGRDSEELGTYLHQPTEDGLRFSNLGPKRTMQWNTVRASFRDIRFTKRRWVASGPNSAYRGQRPHPR